MWEPRQRRRWAPGAAARWWLARSLTALDADLRRRGSRLAVHAGDPRDLLPALAGALGARAVVWAAGLEPEEAADDAAVAAALSAAGIEPVRVPSGNLLLDPGGPLTGAGRPYTVFTPYWRSCLRQLQEGSRTAAAAPAVLPSAPEAPRSPAPLDVRSLIASTGHSMDRRVQR